MPLRLIALVTFIMISAACSKVKTEHTVAVPKSSDQEPRFNWNQPGPAVAVGEPIWTEGDKKIALYDFQDFPLGEFFYDLEARTLTCNCGEFFGGKKIVPVGAEDHERIMASLKKIKRIDRIEECPENIPSHYVAEDIVIFHADGVASAYSGLGVYEYYSSTGTRLDVIYPDTPPDKQCSAVQKRTAVTLPQYVEMGGDIGQILAYFRVIYDDGKF